MKFSVRITRRVRAMPKDVTGRSDDIESIVSRSLVSYTSTFHGQIDISSPNNDSTCVREPPNGPSIKSSH